MKNIQIALIILSVFLSGLASAQEWEVKFVTRAIEAGQHVTFHFPDTPVLHFNVSCTRACDVLLMEQNDHLEWQSGKNFTQNYQALSIFNTALTMVNFKSEKHTLVIVNHHDETILAQVVLSEQNLQDHAEPHLEITLLGSIVFYLSIFTSVLYLMKKK